jgi:hypothetical protein
MKKIGGFQFAIGVIVGATAFGGAAAYAAGIMAQPKTAAIIIDGKDVDLKGYLIEGAHYFQLRDLDEKLMASGKDFSVVWDGQGNRVIIDTSRSYDPNEQYISQPATTPPATQTPTTGGYGTVYRPLKKGDVVNTSSGDYIITQGAEDKPWQTSDGTTWPDVPLPSWQPEWDTYPRVAMPSPRTERYTGTRYGASYDTLYVFNDYEVERMIRTIYRYAKNNPSLWQDGNPASNVPFFSIKVEFTDDMTYNTFYPWRDWEVEKLVNSTFGGKEFRIYAVDDYNNGKFVDTEYFIK